MNKQNMNYEDFTIKSIAQISLVSNIHTLIKYLVSL